MQRNNETGFQPRTRIHCHSYVVAGLALVCLATASFSAEVRLEWDPSADSRVDGYRVHFGTATSNYPWSVDVGDQTNATVSGLQPGVTYYFASTAYDLDTGSVSPFSNEVHITIGPSITSPTPGSVLSGSNATFRWRSNGIEVERWALYIGSIQGGADILATRELTRFRLQWWAFRLPTDGRSVFVRLTYRTDNTWRFVDFVYQAAGAPP